MFQLATTFTDPAGSQSGFPSPGEGAQYTGAKNAPHNATIPSVNDPRRPTQGLRSFFAPFLGSNAQRGMPSPEDRFQERPEGSMPNDPPIFGGVYQHYTPYYDRGAAAYVPNFGYVLTNPIGAGVVNLYRPQASYGPSGQYYDEAIWWTNQVTPTSVNLQGLTDPAALEAIVGQTNVIAMVRTTG